MLVSAESAKGKALFETICVVLLGAIILTGAEVLDNFIGSGKTKIVFLAIISFLVAIVIFRGSYKDDFSPVNYQAINFRQPWLKIWLVSCCMIILLLCVGTVSGYINPPKSFSTFQLASCIGIVVVPVFYAIRVERHLQLEN